jgi:hypothetical protein
MTSIVKKAILAGTLGATALAVASPADAQRYRSHRHHDNTGAAVFAGVAGLAIGAALASDHRYDYDRRYYRDHGYYPTDGYYYRHDYRGYDNCYVRRTWDPYTHRRVLVRYCR